MYKRRFAILYLLLACSKPAPDPAKEPLVPWIKGDQNAGRRAPLADLRWQALKRLVDEAAEKCRQTPGSYVVWTGEKFDCRKPIEPSGAVGGGPGSSRPAERRITASE
jgi:hypothetical protein